jgi:hypothetical protein
MRKIFAQRFAQASRRLTGGFRRRLRAPPAEEIDLSNK